MSKEKGGDWWIKSRWDERVVVEGRGWFESRGGEIMSGTWWWKLLNPKDCSVLSNRLKWRTCQLSLFSFRLQHCNALRHPNCHHHCVQPALGSQKKWEGSIKDQCIAVWTLHTTGLRCIGIIFSSSDVCYGEGMKYKSIWLSHHLHHLWIASTKLFYLLAQPFQDLYWEPSLFRL